MCARGNWADAINAMAFIMVAMKATQRGGEREGGGGVAEWKALDTHHIASVSTRS